MSTTVKLLVASVFVLSLAPAAIGQDGQNIGDGQTLLFTQDTPTQFGNATGGGQNSAGGSEINQVFGDYDSGSSVLNLSISGNLEGNFNKLYLFFDSVIGGENVLDGTNTDGGFNEIQNMAGLTFDNGFTADRGLRIEIGDGFWGVNQFNVIDDSSSSIASGGGPGDLPLSGVGSGGVLLGWDNSNILGVTDASAADAATATTGFEFAIDMTTFLGTAPTQDIGVAGFVSDGGAGFMSNQIIGGVGGVGNLGTSSNVDFNTFAGNQFVTIHVPTAIPEPSTAFSLALLSLVGVSLRRRR